MPTHPSRTPPGQRHPAAAFSPEDVAAFRLRPLGHLGTPPPTQPSAARRHASTWTAASSSAHSHVQSPATPPLPSLAASPPPKTSSFSSSSQQRTGGGHSPAAAAFAASYPAAVSALPPPPPPSLPTSSFAPMKGAQERTEKGGIHVPGAAVPQVYAALIPNSNTVTAAAVVAAGGVNATSHSPVINGRGEIIRGVDALRGGAAGSQSSPSSAATAAVMEAEALQNLPTPATADIPAPSLRTVDVQELTLWTRDAAAVPGRPSATNTTTATTTTATSRDNTSSLSSPSPLRTVTVPTTALTASDAEVLHHWWRSRTAVRLEHRHEAALARDLAPVLESAVRSTLTAEEAYWQQQRAEAHAKGIMNSTPAHTAVPAGKMEALMRAVQLILHQTTVSFVEAQVSLTQKTTRPAMSPSSPLADDDDGDATPMGSGGNAHHHYDKIQEELQAAQQRAEVLQSTLQAERILVAETRAADSVLTAPSVASLPPEAPIPPPVLRMEAAVAVTLLARILEQAEANTPGASFALHLLHRYVAPHLYSDYAAWAAVRPRMGNLSEQVTHLATLPLRVHQQRDLVVAAAQARDDVRYLEAVVKGWTMRSWLRYATGERQRVARCAAFERAFDRLQTRLRLQRGFTRWQHRLQRRQQQRQDAAMVSEYQQFLTYSQATTGLAVDTKALILPNENNAGAGGPPITAAALMRTTLPGARAEQHLAPVNTSVRSLGNTSVLPAHLSRISNNSRRKGAGHSRVYVSFIRRKASNTAATTTGGAGGGSTPSGDAAEDSDGDDGQSEVERYTVRHSDSDADFSENSGDDSGSEGYLAERTSGFSNVPLLTRGGLSSMRSLKSNTGGGGGSVAPGGASLMYLEAPKPMTDVTFPTVIEVDTESAQSPSRGADGPIAAATTAAAAAAASTKTQPALFSAMLAKLHEMEHVNAYLRKELSIQSRRQRKVEADNHALRQRNSELEKGTLKLVQEKLEACNTVQQHNVIIAEKNRQLRLLRSRLRAHRHRPWQQAMMRLVGDVCAVSTAEAEHADEVRVRHDRYGTTDTEKGQRIGQKPSGWNRSASPTTDFIAVGDASEKPKSQQQQLTTGSTVLTINPAPPVEVPTEEERLFGRIAPIVLHSTRQLPDARLILVDWCNSCLDDLQRLDDLNGTPLSARFSSFSEEARSGVLLSRLLYYLALPRYRAQTSAADTTVDVSLGKGGGGGGGVNELAEESQTVNSNWAAMDPRRQLLEQHGVQLDPPYPVYEDCFGGVLALPPVDRMSQLLAFATELMTSRAGDPADLQWNTNLPDDLAASLSRDRTATSATEKNNKPAPPEGDAKSGDGATNTANTTSTTANAAVAPAPVVPLPLHTVVDPYALARGESTAVVTFVALLYVRFAHPFHHKTRHCASLERRMLLQLWSNGDATAAELANPVDNGSHMRGSMSSDSLITFLPCEDDLAEGGAATGAAAAAGGGEGLSSASPPAPLSANPISGSVGDGYSIESEMLKQLSAEDKTPWQLFRERCLPVFGTQAHPFLLRGGFWPADAFDSPELAAMLGSLAMALRRSLELHRWHVTLSCLVPVRTYTGLTRGIFTGPNASPAALQRGLRQDGQDWLCLDLPPLQRAVAVRQADYRQAREAHGSPFASPFGSPLKKPKAAPAAEPQSPKDAAALGEIMALTKAVTSVWQEDLLALFTQRAALSPQLALPVLDLGGWRLLCSDLGLIDMSTPDDNDNDASGDPRESPTAKALGAAVPSTMQRRSLDLEVVTLIFQRAVMAVAQERDEVDPAVFTTSTTAAHVGVSPAAAALSMHAERPRQTSTSMEYVMDVTGGAAGAAAAFGDVSLPQEDNAGGNRSTALPVFYPPTHVDIPDIQMDMTYAAFVLALALLADALFPGPYFPRLVTASLSPLSLHLDNNNTNNNTASAFGVHSNKQNSPRGGSAKVLASPVLSPTDGDAITLDPTDAPPTSRAMQYCSLPMAFAEMMRCVVLASPVVPLHPHDPRSVLRRLTSGLATQMVLHHTAPALLLVYQAYSKDVFGEIGLLREDLLRLLRDAMLTSTELSQYLVYDLFANCAVLRQASEEAALSVRKDKDGRLRRINSTTNNNNVSATSLAHRPGYRAVRIVDPRTTSDNSSTAAAQRRRAFVLTFEGFCDLVCVLCSFKQPNVFVPFEERLALFIRRSLLRPLAHTVPGLAQMLVQSQAVLEAQEAPAKNATAPTTPSEPSAASTAL